MPCLGWQQSNDFPNRGYRGCLAKVLKVRLGQTHWSNRIAFESLNTTYSSGILLVVSKSGLLLHVIGFTQVTQIFFPTVPNPDPSRHHKLMVLQRLPAPIPSSKVCVIRVKLAAATSEV